MLSYFEEILAEQAALWAGEEEIFSLGGSGVLPSFLGDHLSSGEELFPSLDVAVMEEMERAEEDSFGHVGLGEDGLLLSGMMAQEVEQWSQEEKSPGGTGQAEKSPGGTGQAEKSPRGKGQEKKSQENKSQVEKMQFSKKRTVGEDLGFGGGLEGLGSGQYGNGFGYGSRGGLGRPWRDGLGEVATLGVQKYPNGLGYLHEGSGLRYLGEELGSGFAQGLGNGSEHGLGGGLEGLGAAENAGSGKYQNGLGYLHEGSGLRYLGEELESGSAQGLDGGSGHAWSGGLGEFGAIGEVATTGVLKYENGLGYLGGGSSSGNSLLAYQQGLLQHQAEKDLLAGRTVGVSSLEDVFRALAGGMEGQMVAMKSPLLPEIIERSEMAGMAEMSGMAESAGMSGVTSVLPSELAKTLVRSGEGDFSGVDLENRDGGDVLGGQEVSRSLLGKMVSGARAVAQTETVAQQWQSGGTGVSLEKKLGHESVAETVKDFDRAVARDARRYDGISG